MYNLRNSLQLFFNHSRKIPWAYKFCFSGVFCIQTVKISFWRYDFKSREHIKSLATKSFNDSNGRFLPADILFNNDTRRAIVKEFFNGRENWNITADNRNADRGAPADRLHHDRLMKCSD